MITREQFENSYIVNDRGELREKFVTLAESFGYGFPKGWNLESLDGRFVTTNHHKNLIDPAGWHHRHNKQPLTLADFEEEKEKEEMETPVIDWSKAPEGYDYWIEYIGYLSENPPPDFHKLGKKGNMEVFIDPEGEYYISSDEDIKVHKRPEQVDIKVGDQVSVEKGNFSISDGGERFIGEVCKVVSLFSNINPFEGEVEMAAVSLSDGTCQCFRKEMLKPYKKTWQDVAQEFIKNDPVLSAYEFVEDMFGNECKEYHEPLKQLAKLIVENIK
jgi:hypothetical protein